MWSSVVAAALVGLLTTSEAARTHAHSHAHHRHNRSDVEKRGGQCQFPSDAGLVAVTPGAQNAGWAMSPDQPCKPGNWCPYACPPGQVSMQWNPKATSYTYPISMDGGLYCDENGNIQKPFPDKDYCVDGTGTVTAVNKAGKPLSFCQTVLPGDESMLIPTLVTDTATLAVPDTSYWCETAAHYYINAPGVGTEGCLWGTSANPIGNWAYYVAGANTDAHGNTFVKIGHNPVVQEPATPFRNTPPSFGVEITCEDGAGCNGLPCKIDPASGLNGVTSSESADGAGGASFCVVTVPKGQKANIVVFEAGGSGAGDSTPSSSPTSVSSSSPTSTSASTSTTPTTTASPTTTSLSSTSLSSSTPPFSSTATPSDASTPLGSPTPKSTPVSYSYAPHVFAETSASADGSAAATPTSGATASASASAKPSSAASPISTGSMTGLALCLIAGIMMQF